MDQSSYQIFLKKNANTRKNLIFFEKYCKLNCRKYDIIISTPLHQPKKTNPAGDTDSLNFFG